MPDFWGFFARFFVSAIPEVAMTLALLTLAIALEIYAARDDEKRNRWFGIGVHLSFTVLPVLIAMPLRIFRDLLGIEPLADLAALPAVAQVVGSLILIDFLRYWEHRLEHRFWWPVHSVHHSQTDLHVANSYGHPLQALPEFFVIAIPLGMIETNASAPVFVGMVLAFQAYIIHAPIRWHLGPLRRVLADGPYHRVHHSVEAHHFGKNYGTGLTVWDQMFGTAYFPAKGEWPATGVEGIAPPRNFAGYLAMPFRQWFRASSPPASDRPLTM